MKTLRQRCEELRIDHSRSWPVWKDGSIEQYRALRAWKNEWWNQLWDWFPDEMKHAGCWDLRGRYGIYRHGNVKPD